MATREGGVGESWLADLVAFAESALSYVDEAAAAELECHKKNGAPHSQVVAQTVADGLRTALLAARGNA